MISIVLHSRITFEMLTGRVVWWQRVHNIQRGWHVVTLALTSEDNVALPVSATIGVDDLWVGGVDHSHGDCLEGSIPHFLGIRKFDLLDNGRLVQSCARSRSTSILNEENFLSCRVPSDSLMEDGVRL